VDAGVFTVGQCENFVNTWKLALRCHLQ